MKRVALSTGLLSILLPWTSTASAHVSIVSGNGIADNTQEIVFGVGHGCDGKDTVSVALEIPDAVVSVRALPGELGPVSVAVDDAGLVRQVTWEKPSAAVLDSDTNYYKVALRLKVPNLPFTQLFFPAHQICQDSDGKQVEVDWIATESNSGESGPEPAPVLNIVPKHYPGWNQFDVAADVRDLSLFFADAQIVWQGDSAYSINPTTVELIGATAGVSVLGSLAAGDKIWVRY